MDDKPESQSIHLHQFANGLTLLAEPMEWLESAAFALLLPAGCRYDPPDRLGLSNLLCEMVQRGCGSRDSRAFVEDLDNLGVSRSSSVGNSHTSFGGAVPADRLHEALAIYADLVLRPYLPGDQLEDGRLACVHEIRSLEDEPGQRVMSELRRRRYDDPFGRGSQGTIAGVGACSEGDVRRYFKRRYSPQGALLSVAGNIDWPKLRDQVEQLWGAWQGEPPGELEEIAAEREYCHLEHDSAQTHIGMAYPSVPYSDTDYYQARGAVGVLSDGMSSRLFTEVRENRGLAYTVYASCHSLKDRGSVLCYAGTTAERAQETLDVLLAEIQKLSDGINEDELRRLKARIKSALIMQQESSASRASAIATDWYYLGRVQTLDEVSQIINNLTCESINRYLAQHRPSEFTLVTLGQKQLELPVGIS